MQLSGAPLMFLLDGISYILSSITPAGLTPLGMALEGVMPDNFHIPNFMLVFNFITLAASKKTRLMFHVKSEEKAEPIQE